MTQHHLDFALYNIWANNRLIQDLSEQDPQILRQELVGSFPTIHDTALHLWFAETGWLARLNGKGWETSSVTNFTGTTIELFTKWKAASEAFKTFVSEADLEKEIKFEHRGEMFSIPSREIIQTVCNHGSYHRGQIVMMLRQLGITQITQTDYIEWVRENHRSNT